MAGATAAPSHPEPPAGREESTVSAPAAVLVPPPSLPTGSRPRLTAVERMRAAAIAPLWLVSAAGWGLTSASLLTWNAVREMPWLER